MSGFKEFLDEGGKFKKGDDIDIKLLQKTLKDMEYFGNMIYLSGNDENSKLQDPKSKEMVAVRKLVGGCNQFSAMYNKFYG